MTEPSSEEADSRAAHDAQVVHTALLSIFNDYHARIADQVALVDILVDAVRRDERERCAAIADRYATAERRADAVLAATKIAAEIRARRDT